MTKGMNINKRTNRFQFLGTLQKIGKSLLFPIAVLPIAALLFRVGIAISSLGAKDTNSEWIYWIGWIIQQPGHVVFDNIGGIYMLGAIFAVGVGFGFSRDSRGEVALVSLIAFVLLSVLVQSEGSLTSLIYGKALTGDGALAGHSELLYVEKGGKAAWSINFGVLGGIIIGIVIANVYNKYYSVELPDILGFFSGRRLIPILGIMFTMLTAFIMAVIWPWINYTLIKFSEALTEGTGTQFGRAGIMGVYGVINRLLIPFGLHHIPNTVFWFQLGEFQSTTAGVVAPVFGDINGFLSGDVIQANGSVLTAGTFQSGFFPVMMFGLPAAGFAIINTADKPEKKKAAALFGGAAIVSFTTGITEPLEFAFLFAAPKLFGLHAILTGIFGFITGVFGIQLGFGFSAGAIDFMLSLPKSFDIANAKSGAAAVMSNPMWIIPIGLAASATHYFVFKWAIKKWNIATPGRNGNVIMLDESSENTATESQGGKFLIKAKALLAAVGGKSNVSNAGWCATRLRLTLNDSSVVNQDQIKNAGVLGQIPIGANGYQIIIGPKVEMVGNEFNNLLHGTNNTVSPVKVESKTTNKVISVFAPVSGKLSKTSSLKDEVFKNDTVGKGLVITPSNGTIVSPVSGTIMVAFPTGHAFGIKADNGAEILIHIGIDTVELNGKGFDTKVKQGDKVTKGQTLSIVDLGYIKKQGKSIETVMVVTSEHQNKIKDMKTTGMIKSGSLLFKV